MASFLLGSPSHLSSSFPLLPITAPRWGPTAPTPSRVPLPPWRSSRVRLRSRFTTSASLNPNILRDVSELCQRSGSKFESSRFGFLLNLHKHLRYEYIDRKKNRRLSGNNNSGPRLAQVIQTTWKVAKSGVEAGANLVPDFIPRPIARMGVTGVGIIVALFLLKSFLSTLFFTVAVMALIYFTFIALNADEVSRPQGGDTYSTDEDALEEARRIMDKYK